MKRWYYRNSHIREMIGQTIVDEPERISHNGLRDPNDPATSDDDDGFQTAEEDFQSADPLPTARSPRAPSADPLPTARSPRAPAAEALPTAPAADPLPTAPAAEALPTAPAATPLVPASPWVMFTNGGRAVYFNENSEAFSEQQPAEGVCNVEQVDAEAFAQFLEMAESGTLIAEANSLIEQSQQTLMQLAEDEQGGGKRKRKRTKKNGKIKRKTKRKIKRKGNVKF